MLLADQMKKRFEFIEQNYLLSVLTTLDSRFKNLHFKDAFALSKRFRFIYSSISTMVSLPVEEDYHSTNSDSTSESGSIDLW